EAGSGSVGVTPSLASPVDELMPLPARLRPADGAEPDGVVPRGAESSESGRSPAGGSLARPRRARRGDVIGGRYVVDGQIGSGTMGRVLRVRHQVLGKPFALKL